MVTVNDYFNGTRAIWKALPLTWVRKLLALQDSDQPVKLGNRTYTKNYSSSESYYWISTDGSYLIRLSNHWSKGSSAKNCQWVATCWWELAGDTGHQSIGTVKNRFNGYVQSKWCAGIVAFRDMARIPRGQRPLSKLERIEMELNSEM